VVPVLTCRLARGAKGEAFETNGGVGGTVLLDLFP